MILEEQNWENLFRFRFDRLDNIKESMERLRVVRNCIMHSRDVAEEEEILIRAEVIRIERALKKVQ